MMMGDFGYFKVMLNDTPTWELFPCDFPGRRPREKLMKPGDTGEGCEGVEHEDFLSNFSVRK